MPAERAGALRRRRATHHRHAPGRNLAEQLERRLEVHLARAQEALGERGGRLAAQAHRLDGRGRRAREEDLDELRRAREKR